MNSIKDVKFIGFLTSDATDEVYRVAAELDMRLNNFLYHRKGDGLGLLLTITTKRQHFSGAHDGCATLSISNYRTDVEKTMYRPVKGYDDITVDRMAQWTREMQDLVYGQIEKCFRSMAGASHGWIISGAIVYERGDKSGVRIWFSLETPAASIGACTMHIAPQTIRTGTLDRPIILPDLPHLDLEEWDFQN